MENYFAPPSKCCVQPTRTEPQTVSESAEPAVALETIKAHIGIEAAIKQFDATLTLYQNAATEKVQALSGFTLIQATFDSYYNCFPPCLLIPYRPKVAVSAIEYTDCDDNPQILATTEYNTFVDKFEAKIKPESCWPDTNDNTPDAVKVTFTAGYGTTTADVPPTFQLAICQVVAFMYANKGDCSEECVSAICLGLKMISCTQDSRAIGGSC